MEETEGLTKIDTTQLEKRVSDAYNAAHEAAGAEANKMFRDNCDAVLLRSTVTAIESRLIVLSLEPLTAADGFRAVIQSGIKKIRKCGGNEKDI